MLMDSKKIAIILIILIVSAGTIAALYFFMQSPTPPSEVIPQDTRSEYNDVAFVSEVYPNTNVDSEFVEIYIPSSFSGSSVTEWYLTTFDGEGLLAIPTITGIDGEDYLAIFMGNGINEPDASDGKATVYLNITDSILDDDGDEVGLFDSEGNIIDFMRYHGGNGDVVFDNWPSSDDGPSRTTKSVSLFGTDTGDSTNWNESMVTPGQPNALSYTTESDYVFEIQSGLNAPYIDVGIDDEIDGKDETIEVSDEGGGVPLDTMIAIIEHLEFSLEYYLGKGFTRGPKTAANNTIKVIVKNGTSTETVGKASTKGVITIKVGTIESDTDLKYVCEHELMHLFQFNTEKEGNDTVDHAPVQNKWWIEGQATYWGIESTKANFNLTNKEIQDEFDRVGDHNWYDHYKDLNRSTFIGWGGSYSDYIGSYLFMKFIKEKYGEDKLKEAFEKAKDNFNNDSKDVSPEDAIAEACGTSWENLLAKFYAWMMTDAITDNGVPERKGHVNVTYTNNTVSDELKVGPYASGVERIKVNGTKPFNINFKLPQGGDWKITIIYVYEDGSRQQAFNTPFSIYHSVAPWPVNPGNHDKKLVEIIIIKTLIQKEGPKTINMTITPIEHTSPYQPKSLIPGGIENWQLPPSFENYTTPEDWPWSLFWLISYTDNSYTESIEIDPDWFPAESFFDVMITLDGDSVVEHENVSSDGPLIIEWDPSWDYGDYIIELRQVTWNSWINGTIVWHHVQKSGSSYDVPDHIDVGECRAADSNEWDYVDSHWYHVMTDDGMEHVIQVYLDPPYIGVGNWTLELYNTTHSDVVLRTTEGEYATDEWPRYLILPSLGDPDYSAIHEYIVRLRYVGGGAGNVSLLTQPYQGRSIDDPLWHTIGTEQVLGITLPYTYTGPVECYVNATVTIGHTYHLQFNASSMFVYGAVWDGNSWVAISWSHDDGTSSWFEVDITAATETISIMFLSELDTQTVFFLTSAEF